MEPASPDFALEHEPAPASVTSKGVGCRDWLGEVTCEDCMALMARYPDKHFDLAIVDPPYGLGDKLKGGKTGGIQLNAAAEWDIAPPPEYFAELFRVSRNQIIWGGNFFPLPTTRAFIIWDKKQPDGMSVAMAEFAWSSFDSPAKVFYQHPTHVTQGKRIHPTQKPIQLYAWLLNRYAEPGQRILDTHLGSGSHAIAAHYFGAHLTACEINPDYYAAAMERIERETKQKKLL